MPRLSMPGHELGSDAAPFPLCGRDGIEEDDWELERRSLRCLTSVMVIGEGVDVAVAVAVAVGFDV